MNDVIEFIQLRLENFLLLLLHLVQLLIVLQSVLCSLSKLVEVLLFLVLLLLTRQEKDGSLVLL